MGFMFLVNEMTRHITIAMQQVIVDISQNNVSYDSTSLNERLSIDVTA
jgi:hypothetical protein